MVLAQSSLHQKHMRGSLYVLNFIISMTFAVTSFYLSSLLIHIGIPENKLGIIFGAGALIGITSLIFSSSLIHTFRSYWLIMASSVIYLFSLLIISFSNSTPITLTAYFISIFATTLLLMILDLFVSKNTIEKNNTGHVRSIFMTTANIAFTSGPFIGGLLLASNNYSRLYFGAALILIPFIIISSFTFFGEKRLYRKQKTHTGSDLLQSLKYVISNINLKNIFIAKFMLYTFYAIMVIYTPLYLHSHIGIPFQTIGMIMSIALLPFIFIEIPVAYLADKYYGEKELLILGLFIMSSTTALFAYLPINTPLYMWIAALFLTRIGASIVEITSEGFFFKQININQTNEISIFRILYPLAYIISPIIGALILIFTSSFTLIFITLSIVLFFSILPASHIIDTK